jgi:hypothetical protein
VYTPLHLKPKRQPTMIPRWSSRIPDRQVSWTSQEKLSVELI